MMTATDKKAVLLISWSSSWEFVTLINLRFMALSIFKSEPVKLTLKSPSKINSVLSGNADNEVSRS